MARKLTARDLFEKFNSRLELTWLAGREESRAVVLTDSDLTARPALAGYLNLIHPNRIQILGEEEIAYLDALQPATRSSTIEEIFGSDVMAVIIGGGLPAPKQLAERAAGSRTPLMTSRLPTHDLVNLLQYHVSRSLARRLTMHGVFMEVFTIGVLITGESASGKSELALELLNRGHRLIADDAPEFTHISPEIIDGTCPEALQDCLEVRGLGVLNIRRMFGDAAIKLNKFLRLIIHLRPPDDSSSPADLDRLHGDEDALRVLELDIPRITLPVLAGRNMAVIAEAAVRNFMLKMKGYDAASAFIERHSGLLQRQARQLED